MKQSVRWPQSSYLIYLRETRTFGTIREYIPNSLLWTHCGVNGIHNIWTLSYLLDKLYHSDSWKLFYRYLKKIVPGLKYNLKTFWCKTWKCDSTRAWGPGLNESILQYGTCMYELGTSYFCVSREDYVIIFQYISLYQTYINNQLRMYKWLY